MARLEEEFDVDSLPVSDRNFDPLPAGWYDVAIEDADVKKTKDETGRYIEVKYRIIGENYNNRIVFGKINTRNKSAQAERIGLEQLGNLLRAIAGVSKLTDTNQLIGKNLSIKLKIREAKDGYEAQNEVTGWKSSEGIPVTKATATTAKSPSASSSAPWMKK